MNTPMKIAMGLAVLFCVWAPALADWDPGMPAKWVQPPDLSDMGLDVNASWNPQRYAYHKVVADDFLCTETGPITDIHIWGSWLGDLVDRDARVKLSIHKDVRPTSEFPYSHPEPEPEWSMVFSPTQYTMRQVQNPTGIVEQFYDPNLQGTTGIIGTDTQVWQYNFLIPAAARFVQQGSTANPVTYWLDVQVQPTISEAIFGWKTSPQQWQDDSTFADTDVFGGPVIGPAPAPVFWRELVDPRTGMSLSQSFVINGVPEPSTIVMLICGAVGVVACAWRRRNQ